MMKNILCFLDCPPKIWDCSAFLASQPKKGVVVVVVFSQHVPLKSFSLGVGLKAPRIFFQDAVPHRWPRTTVRTEEGCAFSHVVGSASFACAPGANRPVLPALRKVLAL